MTSRRLNSFIGEYRLVDFIGAGGMGEVYRAVHAQIGRVVAIKVLSQIESGSRLSERFLNEARIQAGLRHPGIATLYDFLEVDGQPCIIMEYVEGRTLDERIRARGRLPTPEALSIFVAVVDAVAYLHDLGIEHRDIKSSNIRVGPSGAVKLLDFGIARDASSRRLTQTGHQIGTLGYLSPEQIAGDRSDARSDVWALGVLLYEMVTGRLPFEADVIPAIADKISKGAYEAPSVLDPSVPGEVDAIASRCPRKRPSERYRSARDLLHDLQLAPALERQSRPDSRPGSAAKAWSESLRLGPRRWLLAGGLMGLLGVATILYFPFGRPGQATLAPAVPPPVGKPEQPKKESLVHIRIETYDGPAEVYEGGVRVGGTPYERDYPLGAVNLELRRHGYKNRPVNLTLVSVAQRTFHYALERND